MKQIFLLISLFSFLGAYEFKLNESDILKINKTYNKKFTVNRLKKFKELLDSLENKNLLLKLNRTNLFINKILPKDDKISSSTDDYWATPKEFLINGYGDCEDYAISKYFSLISLGVSKNNLYLSIVKIQTSKTLHMVLMYIENKTKIPLVLDNLSSKILPLNKRKDLKVKFLFNEKSSYLLKNNKIHKKVNIKWGKENKWKDLLNRVYSKKE